MDIGYPEGVDEMDVNTVRAQIKQKQLQHFYIFTGPEWKGQKIYIEQIGKVHGNGIQYVDGIKSIYNKLKNTSFVNKSSVYVMRDDKDLIQNEKLQSQLDTLIGTNIIILVLTSVDKRTKFYKKYKDDIVEFEHFDERLLVKYIQRDIKLTEDNCKKLIEVCESDYGRILLEIDKIKRYVNYLGPAPMFDGVFEKLLQDGTIYQPPKDAIFDLVDAILDRKISCWQLLNDCYAVGEANMVILTVLYNNIKATLQVQSCQSSDVAKSTGLTGWQIMNAKKHLNNYSNGELVSAMRIIQEVESGIKTGKIDDDISVEYVLANVL